jgi:hypothetical protein
MKYLFLIGLAISLFACSGSATETATSPETTPPEAALVKAEVVPPPPATPFATGTEVCQLYSADKVARLLGCDNDLKPKIDNSERSYNCLFMCTAPFSTFSVSAGWTKSGNKQDVSRRDDNPALEKINIPGADAAHFVEAQGRLMLAKGKYLVTVQIAAGERDVIFEVAEEVLAGL